jgi:lipopolysaccharide biosynthesis regulator YciM
MEEEKLSDFRDDFQMLIEAAFIAVKQLDEVSATRMFHAAHVLNTTSTAPYIGLGFIALNKLETGKAVKIFEEVLKQEPENYLAQAFLGICFLLNKPKRKKGEQLIKEAMEKTNDQTIKDLGSISLEWAEKDLKKMKKDKAPFFMASEAEAAEANEEEEEKN